MLFNFDPPATDDEIRAAALQYVRKVGGATKPSQVNEAAFAQAVDAVACATRELLDALVTKAPPKDREVEAERAGLYGTDHFEQFADPMDAARDADLVTTDVWTSMGFEAENEERLRDFADWQVDAEMMRAAKSDAVFMHCLPAHRGEEVAAAVIDGPQSVVWDEAENRLHVQKALMEFLLLGRVND